MHFQDNITLKTLRLCSFFCYSSFIGIIKDEQIIGRELL